MKTNPKQLASILHWWKGPLNNAALVQRAAYAAQAHVKPIKKGYDYTTRSTVKDPKCCGEYKRMANGELRHLAIKLRNGAGKARRREHIKVLRNF